MKKLIFYILFVNISLALCQDELIKPSNLMLLTNEYGVEHCPLPVYLDTTGIGNIIISNPLSIRDSRMYEGKLYGFGPLYFSNTTMHYKTNIFNLNDKSNEELISLNDINSNYDEILLKFNKLEQEFGKFEIILKDKNSLKFEIVFKNIVNIDKVKSYLKRIHFDYNCTDYCSPIFWLKIPNERTFIPGIWPREVLSGDYTSAETWYSNNYHKRGWNWHHYSLKTPIAWEITMSDPSIVIGAEDAFNCNSPVSNSNLIDFSLHNNSGGNNGNWTEHKNTDVTDGFYGVNTPGITKGYSNSHGLVVLSYAICYSNNDNLLSVPNSPAGGLLGTAPKSRGVGVIFGGTSCSNNLSTSDAYKIDNDLTQNNYINRFVAYNQSNATLGDSIDMHIQMNNGIVLTNAAGNGMYNNKPELMSWGTQIFQDPDTYDPQDDFKSISVGALADGVKYSHACEEWEGLSPANPPATLQGDEHFYIGWNYSSSISKFNNSSTFSVRKLEKKGAYIDVVAPAKDLLSPTAQITTTDTDRTLGVDASGTSFAAPMVAGVVGLMSSVNRYLSEPLDSYGYPVKGINVQKKAYNIITFTADKVIDNGDLPSGFPTSPLVQPEYVEQTNDELKRWWAQRMGFGKVNAYRSVAHSIANKVPYEITSPSYQLDFADDDGGSPADSRGYVNPDGVQLLHMGSFVKEGSGATYPANDFWEIPITRGPNSTNDGVLSVLEWGGSSIPFISSFHNNSDSDLANDHDYYNNQGVTIFNSTTPIELNVGQDQILAIDGMLISEQNNVGHNIKTTDLDDEDGLIIIEGYLRHIELSGNLRVGDLIIDGSVTPRNGGPSCLWFGNNGTRSEVYGRVKLVNYGMFMGGGGHLTFQPGAELSLLGESDTYLKYNSEWHFKGATEVNTSNNKGIIIEGGSKLYIDESQKVNLDVPVYVSSCAELIVEKDALLKIKQLTVANGGTFTIEEGAHVTFSGTNHSLLGYNNFNGVNGNEILLRANTANSCSYEDTEVIGNAFIELCMPDSLSQDYVIVDTSITENPVPCNYTCPVNSDDWLVLYSEKGGDCEEIGACQITFDLNIPFKYTCSGYYKYYKLTLTVNSVPTTYTITSLDDLSVLNNINDCISNNTTYKVTIALMTSLGDTLNPCIVEQTVECECNCPNDSKDWLDIVSLPNDPLCDEGQCYIINDLNIPEDYPCYTHMTFSNTISTPYTQTSNNVGIVPINGFNLSSMNVCIDAGDIYHAKITLYKGPFDSIPCVIEKSAFCPVTDSVGPCLPDCYSDTFTKEDNLFVELDGCPGCYINISFYSRHACNIWNDIQITSIEKVNATGTNPSACDGCDDSYVYQQAIKEIISSKIDVFGPFNTNECSDVWRVSKASCWTKWTREIFDPTSGNTREITINKPCNSDCCLRRMRVCKLGGDTITIEDMGMFYPVDACTSVTFQQPEPPYETLSCSFTCDMLEDISETFLGKISIEEDNIKDYFIPRNSNELSIEINVSQNENTFRILTDKSNASHITISIYNLNGQLMNSKTNNLTGGLDYYDFDISNYLSGTYIYAISIDGYKVKSGKFNIVR